ncbi:MAG: haloacid dehalogenase-like hydrolase [Candidatus Omnitrophica bacterium]|nr:haloacid dehalogenase-like hydrolase [Candidatus Omnitrophota bacterium]
MPKNTIALVYDFDKTLSPRSMQNYTVLPNLGIEKTGVFWNEVGKESQKENAESNLVWMRKIKELAEDGQKLITKEYFKKCGRNIEYFAGVEGFFSQINRYVKQASHNRMAVRHYIISAGLKEILEGISIRREFYNIFGSEYHYDHSGRPIWPKVLITDTIKTQYLFRINKGKENINESINEHMPEDARPIPFENMIYIGDGISDVPAMTLTKKNGGRSIAVYKPRKRKGLSICKQLLKANRVDFIARADYTKGKELYGYVTATLDLIIKRFEFQMKSEGNRRVLSP